MHNPLVLLILYLRHDAWLLHLTSIFTLPVARMLREYDAVTDLIPGIRHLEESQDYPAPAT